MIRLILLGVLSGAFFSSTFILNEVMSVSGGHCDIYFFNLHYEVHIKCIGTEVSNLMVSSILVFYFLVVYLFQLYSIPAILNYEA